jgi:hypothetical protein
MILNVIAILLLAVWFYGMVLGYVGSGWVWVALLGAVAIFLGRIVR